MTAQSILQPVGISDNKTLMIHILKQKADGEIRNHRSSIPPLHDVEQQMAAVNAHLAQDGYAPISDAEIASIRVLADEAWEGYVQPPAVEFI